MKSYRLPGLLILALSFLPLAPAPAGAVVQGMAANRGSTATMRLAGLKDRVTVRRDERGVPYIEAANEEDLYFAQGYVTASDRLWQMDLVRRTARGELSEIFGKATLEEDKRRRLLGFAGLAEALAQKMSAPLRSAVEAYSRGVNAYLDSLDEKSLPTEFQILQYRPRPWTPADSLSVGKIFAETLSTSWRSDIMRAAFASLPREKYEALFPETSPLDVVMVGTDGSSRTASAPVPSALDARLKPTDLEVLRAATEIERTMADSLARIGLYAEDRAMSNNWVVSGRRTASGKPLLANDPHLPPGAPSIWYMVELSAPGLHEAGVASPGSPGILIGHNDRIAWGATALELDVQDLYLEKFDRDNPRRYLTPAGWRDAEVRHEEIKVRESLTSPATQTVPLDVTVTRHGPIILESNGARYALRWPALDPESSEAEAFFAIDHVHNWDEFRAALRDFPGPSFNFIYADVDGHIGYYGAGHVPIRKTGDGSVPYDGSTDAGDWTGYIPFDQLPHLYDPPDGLIVTANNRLIGRDYRYFLSHEWPAPYRARRIFDLLRAKNKLTIDDFRAVQGDVYSLGGMMFAREVVRRAHEQPSAGDDQWKETVSLFETWDGRMSADSRAAAMVATMRAAFRQRILSAALPAELARQYRWANSDTFVDRIITERPAGWLPGEFKDYTGLLRACAADARDTLTKRLGPDESQWVWGKIAQVRFPHPLAGVPFIGQQFAIPAFPQNGSGGNTTTVNVGANVSMRFIADTGDWDRSQQGIPPGESGNPSSAHWKDQLDDWRAVTPRPFPFSKTAVAHAAKEILMLEPAAK